jgi:hypothetical protein
MSSVGGRATIYQRPVLGFDAMFSARSFSGAWLCGQERSPMPT